MSSKSGTCFSILLWYFGSSFSWWFNSFDRKGWFSIWEVVILLEGSHLRHYKMKSRPSFGQSGITSLSEISENYGKFIPFIAACFTPSGQFFSVGEPSTEQSLLIWSNYEFPMNKGFIKYISATRQPRAKTSTGVEYDENLNRSYGARYHLVEMYSVKGGLLLIYFAIPKSMILAVRLLEMRTFSGFISLWKNPFLCMYCNASTICLVKLLISKSFSFLPFSFLSVMSL